MSFKFLIFYLLLPSVHCLAHCIDSIPPTVDSVVISNSNQVFVYFSEPVNNVTAEDATNYILIASGAQPTYATMANNRKVLLAFTDSFTQRQIYSLSVSGIADIYNNAMPAAQTIPFYQYYSLPFDIVINELMADPSPPVALPEVEWIELYNNSPFSINLSGWRLAKNSGRSGPLPNYLLQPDSFLLVCSSGSVTELLPWGPVKSVTSFPTLSNLSDCIYLVSPQGHIIHTVNYTDSWYQDELKKLGGWSLEMKDPKNPCGGIKNWMAGNDSRGSTPAAANSIKTSNPDITSPEIMWLYVPDSLHILLQASEPLDSNSAVQLNRYFVSNQIGVPIHAVAEPPLFQQIRLELASPLVRGNNYRLTIQPLQDCLLNQGAAPQEMDLAIPQLPNPGDVVVNEILFNPPSIGADYVEVYNRSKKVIDLQKLFIANRNTMGQLDNIVKFSGENRMLFPDQYLLLSDDTAFVKKSYRPLNEKSLLQHGALPSFNDDEGYVVILRADGQLLDELHYDDNWHFEFITNTEGVALERLDVNAPTQTNHNWHSAAESVNYGTPGYRNSQTINNTIAEGTIAVFPKMVTPNNDGQDDFLSIQYQFPEPGNVANIKLFDLSGRFIRWIANNFQCGTTGRLIWDGLGQEKNQLIPGAYLIYTETLNSKGKVRKFKNVVLVGR